MASSLDNPFFIALQYFFEKFLEILFCNKLTLGSEELKACVIGGLNKKIIVKRTPINNLNKLLWILYLHYN